MEANILNKKNTSYRTFCHVCLSRDRRLFSIEKYVNIFQNICEGKFTSHTLLCWECTAVLRRIKQFKETVELSTKILNKYKYVNGPVYPFNSLSKLKITENGAIIKYEECEKVNNIKVEIVVNSSNVDYNPIINYSLEENEKLIDVKQEFSDNDNDIVFNDTDSFENKDPYFEVKSEDTPKTGKECAVKSENMPTTGKECVVKSEDTPATSKECVVKSEDTPATGKKGKHNKKKLKSLYRIVPNDVNSVKSLVRKVLLTTEKVKSYMDEQRSSVSYKNSAYRCEQCALSWNNENRFLQHNKRYHTESAGKLQCDICLSRFKTKKGLILHLQQRHFIILECCTCAYRSYRVVTEGHLETHLKRYECIKCNARFGKICLLRQHYKELHRIFICDICGKKAKSKRVIGKHINRHFEKYECKLCDRMYTTKDCLKQHQKNKHSPKTADAYCVQCDKKFCNNAGYREHLLRSSAHAAESGKKKVPCPDCGRQYSRRSYMNNHYRLAHTKQSKHYCELCNKYFLTGSRYSQHVMYVHERVKKEKNKLCNICGRGFSVNRILNNHIRTHTGERPHECSYCGAKFIQEYAMRLHVNNVHLKDKRPNLK